MESDKSTANHEAASIDPILDMKHTIDDELLTIKHLIEDNQLEGIESRINDSISLCKKHGSISQLGMALLNLSDFYRKTTSLETVLTCLESCLTQFIAAEDYPNQIRTYNRLGRVCMELDNETKAIDYFFRGLDILNQEKAYESDRVPIMNNLGTMYSDKGDYKRAITFFTQAYDICLRNNTGKSMAILAYNIAELSYFLGDYDNCERFSQIALEGSAATDDHIGVIYARLLKDLLDYHKNQDLSGLIENFYTHKANMVAITDLTDVVDLSYLLCRSLYLMEMWEDVAPILAETIDMILGNDMSMKLDSCQKMLRKVYIHLGNYKDAYDLLADEFEALQKNTERYKTNHYDQVMANYNKINAQNYVDQLEDSIRVFKLMAEIGHSITLNRDIKGIFDYIVDHIYDIWQLDVFGFAVIDESKEHLIYYYNSKEEGYHVRERDRSDGAILMNYCINSNKEILINDAKETANYKSQFSPDLVESLKNNNVRSLILLPLFINDQVIGGITVQSMIPNYFSHKDIEILKALAGYCSAAVLNDRRHHQLLAMKDLDGLTQTLNRHALMNYADELNRYQMNTDKTLFIAMLDIDYFKGYNDNYGHTVGDGCIVNIAQLIQAKVREQGGKLFRYGGDEFMIIIEDFPEADAVALLSNVAKTLRDMNIQHEYSKVADRVTLSIGGLIISNYDRDLSSYYPLVDDILYKVKAKGRNGYLIENTD